MPPPEQLLSYLRSELARGVQHDDLVRVLTSSGWDAAVVNAAFRALEPAAPEAPQPPAPPAPPAPASGQEAEGAPRETVTINETGSGPQPQTAESPAQAAKPPSRMVIYIVVGVLAVLAIAGIYVAYTFTAPPAPAAQQSTLPPVATTTPQSVQSPIATTTPVATTTATP